jgi:hypothetical protein
MTPRRFHEFRRATPIIGRTILGMSRIHPDRPDSDAPDGSVAADVLLRQEPHEEEEEEEEEEEGDGKEDADDDDATDDGYSECACS